MIAPGPGGALATAVCVPRCLCRAVFPVWGSGKGAVDS
jgi:hypothetical protein